MNLLRSVSQTPIGEMVLLAQENTLVALMWGDGIERTERHLHRHLNGWNATKVNEIAGWSSALHDYWSGHDAPFQNLALSPPGTPFQQRVWRALRTIPLGSTWSYRQLAQAIGQPTAYRAVANANGKNPIPIVTPCHRVIQADGGLGGFSGGLDKKKWLLRHEGHAW